MLKINLQSVVVCLKGELPRSAKIHGGSAKQYGGKIIKTFARKSGGFLF